MNLTKTLALTASSITLIALFAKTPQIVNFFAFEGTNTWLEGGIFSSTNPQSSNFGLEFQGVLNFNNLSETQGDNFFLAVGSNKLTFHFKNI